jgi:type I restriction enzyme S subunit
VTVNQDLKALSPSAGLNSDFITWALRAFGRAILNSCKKDGTTVASIEFEALKRFEIPLAPKPEQARIVEALDSHLSRLDAAVASLERVQAKLRLYRASVLKAAVEGRLVPTEAELARRENRDYEPASVLLERILKERRRRWEEAELARLQRAGKGPKDDKWKANYKEPAPPTDDVVRDLPEGWLGVSLSQIAECLDRLRVPVSKRGREKRTGKVPYYGANGQVGWIERPLFNEPLVLVVEDETFTGREKPFSYLIDGPAWVNNHAHVLRPAEGVDPKFLNYSLSYYPFIPLTTGTTGRRKLTQANLMPIALALPPIQEQERIVAEADRHLSQIDHLEKSLPSEVSRIAALRQAILKWAFEGKLVDQDPTDEPAEKLLERIRAERAAAAPGNNTRRRRAAEPTRSR